MPSPPCPSPLVSCKGTVVYSPWVLTVHASSQDPPCQTNQTLWKTSRQCWVWTYATTEVPKETVLLEGRTSQLICGQVRIFLPGEFFLVSYNARSDTFSLPQVGSRQFWSTMPSTRDSCLKGRVTWHRGRATRSKRLQRAQFFLHSSQDF